MPVSDDAMPGLLAESRAGDNAPPFTVSELSGALRRTVEDAFGHVRVRGEISGWKRHASGHCYLTLKDADACMDGVLWRRSAAALAFRPEDGAEVIATGKLTTYPGRSKYQIVIDRLELAGEGALMALLDRRRRTLAAEGLFDEARKRPLPFLPHTIGVVTSQTGAVIRDILHRLADRCPTRVIVWPVPVQGEGAAARIAAALHGFGAMEDRPDLLIVARGGGSIEDLWAFNEEEVVRAAAASPIPLISAVGHETDTTLIDHAADRRAPTPTAAAEMAVPVRAELMAMLGELAARARSCLSRGADRARERLALTVCRLPEPEALLAQPRQRVDEIGGRLPRALAARAGHARADLAGIGPRLRPALLQQRVDRSVEKLAGLWRLAELAHPERPLARGFARVTAPDGRTMVSAEQARRVAAMTLRFADGEVAVTPAAALPIASSRRVERKPPAHYPLRQRGLFDAED